MKFDIKCSEHPEYKALRFPSGKHRCDACVTIYYLKQHGQVVTDFNQNTGRFTYLKNDSSRRKSNGQK